MVATAYKESLLEFFKFIFPIMPAGYTIELRTINPPKTTQTWALTPSATMVSLDTISEPNIYFGVLPRISGHGDRAHVYTHSNMLWADLDEKSGSTFQDLLESPLPTPCIVVASGHGWHAYWRLKNWFVLDYIEMLNRNIAAVLNSDAVGDAARIMRVPYTINEKRGTGMMPVMATLMSLQLGCDGHYANSFMNRPEYGDKVFRKREITRRRLELPLGHTSRSEVLFSQAIEYTKAGGTDIDELEQLLLDMPEGSKLEEMSPARRRTWTELTYKNAKRVISKRPRLWTP